MWQQYFKGLQTSFVAKHCQDALLCHGTIPLQNQRTKLSHERAKQKQILHLMPQARFYSKYLNTKSQEKQKALTNSSRTS